MTRTLPPSTDLRFLREALRSRIAQLNPDLSPDSPTFRAAMLLLAGCILPHSVHKLAAAAGTEIEFAARCARRLVDNGVWREGQTAAVWIHSDVEQVAFWADVGVAEGKLCRRVDESGRVQWAAAGEWWKEFDYSLRGEPERTRVEYQSRRSTAPAAEGLPSGCDRVDTAISSAQEWLRPAATPRFSEPSFRQEVPTVLGATERLEVVWLA